jgi:hypothetical protein
MRYFYSRVSARLGSWQLLYLTLGVLIAVGLWFSAVSSATAHHRKPYFHLASLHGDVENTCSESHYSSLNETNMRNRVANALGGNGIYDWNGVGGGIDIRLEGTYCSGLSSSDRYNMELEYHGWITGSQGLADACGNDGTTSCAVAGARTYFPGGGYLHAGYYRMHLQSNWLGTDTVYNNDKWRHVINHESGHAFGLADPGVCEGFNDSVMHSKFVYGCAEDSPWPWQSDRDSVNIIIQKQDNID